MCEVLVSEQTFACVAYCSSKTPVRSLKFTVLLLELPQSFVYDRLWKLKMSAHGRFFICLVSGLLPCWWQGQECFMMTRRNCQSPVLYRITCLCSDAERRWAPLSAMSISGTSAWCVCDWHALFPFWHLFSPDAPLFTVTAAERNKLYRNHPFTTKVINVLTRKLSLSNPRAHSSLKK